jgi:hypothetical protein
MADALCTRQRKRCCRPGQSEARTPSTANQSFVSCPDPSYEALLAEPFRRNCQAGRKNNCISTQVASAAAPIASGMHRDCIAVAREKPAICFAHVTNQMARSEGDFEKGEADGAFEALQIISRTARTLASDRCGALLR